MQKHLTKLNYIINNISQLEDIKSFIYDIIQNNKNVDNLISMFFGWMPWC